ncbi:MAG: hypothetical protein ACJ8GN_24765 [Longimicrobiaceae bacterium]
MSAPDFRRGVLAPFPFLAIRCPRCGKEAAFEPATYVLYGGEAKAAAADASLTGVWRGHAYVVLRYPHLVDWKTLVRLRREVRQVGICRCGACGYLNRHLLDWPREAYFSVSLRGRTLWMRSREHVIALRGYVAAEDRQRVPGTRWLSRVPKEFLAARNRAPLVKKLDRLLAEGPEPRAVPSRPDPLSPRPRR